MAEDAALWRASGSAPWLQDSGSKEGIRTSAEAVWLQARHARKLCLGRNLSNVESEDQPTFFPLQGFSKVHSSS